jgi:hypothetical protein
LWIVLGAAVGCPFIVAFCIITCKLCLRRYGPSKELWCATDSNVVDRDTPQRRQQPPVDATLPAYDGHYGTDVERQLTSQPPFVTSSTGYDPPPYDVALTMPRPQIGSSRMKKPATVLRVNEFVATLNSVVEHELMSSPTTSSKSASDLVPDQVTRDASTPPPSYSSSLAAAATVVD